LEQTTPHCLRIILSRLWGREPRHSFGTAFEVTMILPNQITGPNAGGPREFPIPAPLTACVGQFGRSAMPLRPRRKSSDRRQCAFLELLALAALWAIPWSSSSAPLPDIFSYRANDLVALRQGFAQAPREAGPWVYWITWDNALTSQELSRELEVLVAAGFSGAEMRIVTFPGWSGPPLDSPAKTQREREPARCIANSNP
jgi:hypothetical protein